MGRVARGECHHRGEARDASGDPHGGRELRIRESGQSQRLAVGPRLLRSGPVTHQPKRNPLGEWNGGSHRDCNERKRLDPDIVRLAEAEALELDTGADR